MHKPQRKSSINRDSLRGAFRPSTNFSGTKSTPLLRTNPRIPLSAAKTNQRESYIGTSNQHAVKDPRTLTDRSYIRRCVNEIIEILAGLNYPNPMTPKTFNPPSNKEYQRVFEFLTFEIMGSFRILGRPEEEMLKALKELGYPYNITKSTLNNVGAMSCWPQALGALMWIADFAKYCGGVDAAIEESLSQDPRKKMRHEFNSRCYSEFMSGNDGPFTELELQLKETIDELDADASIELEKLKSKHAKLAAEYKQKIEKKEALQNLSEDIQTKKGNIEKMKQYLRQCDDYVNVMKNKAKELQETIKTKEAELASSKEVLIQLNSQVSQQDLNRADMEEIVREKRQLREAISATTDRLQQLKNTKYDFDVKVGKLVSKGNELAETFNTQLKTVSSSLSFIKDHLPDLACVNTHDFTLSLGHKGLENEDVLVKTIEPFLTSLNNKMLEALGSLETEYYNICKRVKQSGEILNDLRKEKEQLQDQHQRLVKEKDMMTEDLRKVEESYNAKILKVDTVLEQLQSAHSESVEDLSAQLEERKKRNQTALERNSRLESAELSSIQKTKLSVKKFQQTLHELANDFVRRMDEADQEALDRLQIAKSRATQLLEAVQKHQAAIKEFDKDS